MSKNAALFLTLATALLCCLPSLLAAVFGGVILSGQPVTVTVNGVSQAQILPPALGLALLLGGCMGILIPITFAVITALKNKA